MKKLLKILCLLLMINITLTGCSLNQSNGGYDGEVSLKWEDVKDDFNDIDNQISQNSEELENLSTTDIKQLTTTIEEGYDKIKDGITQDNHQEALKVYEAAAKLDYLADKYEDNLTDKQQEMLEIGENTKELMMYYYGNGDDDFQEAVNDVENGLENLKDYAEEKWDELIENLQ